MGDWGAEAPLYGEVVPLYGSDSKTLTLLHDLESDPNMFVVIFATALGKKALIDWPDIHNLYVSLMTGSLSHEFSQSCESQMLYLRQCYENGFIAYAGYVYIVDSTILAFSDNYVLRYRYKNFVHVRAGYVYDCGTMLVYWFGHWTGYPNKRDEITKALDRLEGVRVKHLLKVDKYRGYIKARLPSRDVYGGKLASGAGVFLFEKDEHEYLLSDFFSTPTIVIDASFVYSLLSQLLIMACYFKVCQIVPLYLNANTIVIDEITHSIRIIGGWWSWAKFGEPVLKMPYETVKMMTEAGEADPIARLFPLDTEKSGCYVMLRQIKSLCLEIYQRGTFILELGWDLYRWLCKVPEKTCLRELSSFYKVFAGVLDKDDEADIKLVLARFRAGPKAK